LQIRQAAADDAVDHIDTVAVFNYDAYLGSPTIISTSGGSS
jgi:hypothetical protein